MNDHQIQRYAESLHQEAGVDIEETKKLLALLSKVEGHDIVLIAYATSLINQGVAVKTLITGMAQLNFVVSKLIAQRQQ